MQVVEYPNGDHYEGSIIDGKRNGYGVLTYSNKDKYSGNWKDDMRHG
jgi:hypothetical protein